MAQSRRVSRKRTNVYKKISSARYSSIYARPRCINLKRLFLLPWP